MAQKKLMLIGIAVCGGISAVVFQNCSSSRFETSGMNVASSKSSTQSDALGTDPSGVVDSPVPAPVTKDPENVDSTCSLSVSVAGESVAGSTGPMGSKVTYLLTFSDANTKSRVRSLAVTLGSSPVLNPIEEQELKSWGKWLNIANDEKSLTTFQIINTSLSPSVTAPGNYTRKFTVLDASQQAVCRTNAVSFTILPDVLKKNLDEVINKTNSRYSVNIASNQTSTCRIVLQSEIKESSRVVSNLNDVDSAYRECKTKCQQEIQVNPKNFSNAKNPNVSGLNGCEYSVPLLLSANGQSRAVVVKDRVFSALDIASAHALSIFSFPAQANHAKYGIGHWAGVNIFEILGGMNVMATDMYLDWNIRPPQEIENLNVNELVP